MNFLRKCQVTPTNEYFDPSGYHGVYGILKVSDISVSIEVDMYFINEYQS